ncbi:MAG: helix-turn-helix transcriptional regulator [Clostridiales bacterium]|nr:helix-turn-helix transcriptional regulator [Clostridiales bacterium]
MIIYDRFWETLKEKGISTYYLINTCKISSSTLTRLRNNKPLSTVTLNDLCRILDCPLESIARYVPSEEDKSL